GGSGGGFGLGHGGTGERGKCGDCADERAGGQGREHWGGRSYPQLSAPGANEIWPESVVGKSGGSTSISVSDGWPWVSLNHLTSASGVSTNGPLDRQQQCVAERPAEPEQNQHGPGQVAGTAVVRPEDQPRGRRPGRPGHQRTAAGANR